MRILFGGSTGLTLGLAMRCESEGHDVRYGSKTDAGKGLVKIFRQEEDWRPDIVTFDDVSKIAEAEACRQNGYKVLGPTKWSNMVESDPEYRRQIIASLGWRTDAGFNGTNLYVSAWFNGSSYIATYSSIVYRRFMAGGAGPDLECTGMISDFRGLTKSTRERILQPLERILKKVTQQGCIHIHLLVNGTDFVVKDISTSLFHPLSFLLYENTFLSSSDVLLRTLDVTSKPIRTAAKWASGIQLSTPPFPYNRAVEPTEIDGITSNNLKHLWLADVFKVNNRYHTCDRGLIGYITSRGDTDPSHRWEYVECIRRAYRTLGNIKAPDLQYRNDIGKNLQGLLHNLRQPGWLE